MKNRNRNLTHATLFALTALAAAACQDRNLDDYRHDKVAAQLAQIEAVAGSYRGTLTSDSTRAPLGEITFKVSRETPLRSSTDSTTTEPQASLQGEIRLENGDQVWVTPFNDGYFDGTTGDFRADVNVQQRSGQTAKIQISGTFSGEHVTGKIVAEGFSDHGGSFDLTRDGPLPDAQTLVGAPRPAEDPNGQQFHALADFTGTQAAVTLTIQLPTFTADQDFYDLFTPVKSADVTVLLRGSPVEFSSAQWDQRRGTIFGRVQGVSGSPAIPYGITLKCRQVKQPDGKAAWDCRYSSDSDGLIFHGVFK